MSSRWGKVLILLAFVVLGAVVGLVGGFMQAQRVVITAFDRYVVLPWGLILMLLILIVLTRLATIAANSRAAAWLFLGGWLAMTLALATESPSGDLALSGGARQLTYLFAGLILCAAIATLPVNFLRGSGSSSRGTGSAPDASIDET